MDKPYLTLVDPASSNAHAEEFIPLPYYGWDERPSTLPLDYDECATALHLAQGDVKAASRLLKVPIIRLMRMLRGSPRLQRVLNESLELMQHDAIHEYALALRADDPRVRWAAAQRVMASRLAQSHPLSPAPPSTAVSASSLTVNQNRSITFRWKTAADRVSNDGTGGDSGDSGG